MKEIRIHGRGGQGSVTAAELLSVAAFEDGKFSQARVRVDKELSDPPTVRVSKLHVHVTLPATVPTAERLAIEHSLANCPVGLSLSPDIDRRLEVEWV